MAADTSGVGRRVTDVLSSAGDRAQDLSEDIQRFLGNIIGGEEPAAETTEQLDLQPQSPPVGTYIQMHRADDRESLQRLLRDGQ